MATLSAAQKTAVATNWAKVQATWGKSTGPEFVIRMFEKFPAIKAKFAMFNGMDSAAIRSSTTFRAHLCHFKHALASFVENLDDIDCLGVLLQKLAENHHKREIDPDLFKHAFATYMAVVKEVTGADDATMAAWDAVFQSVHDILSAKMKAL